MNQLADLPASARVAQELQRVFAVAIGEIGLQHAKPGDLTRQVVRVGNDRRERDDHAHEQTFGRRPCRIERAHSHCIIAAVMCRTVHLNRERTV